MLTEHKHTLAQLSPQFHDGHLAVNVKVCGAAWNDAAAAEWPGLTEWWADTHLTDADRAALWEFACEHGWAMAQDKAIEAFGDGATVYGEGRSSGWLVVAVRGRVLSRDDWEEWGEEDRRRWLVFAAECRELADDTPYQYTWAIGADEYEPWQEAQRQRANACEAARDFWGNAPYGQAVPA